VKINELRDGMKRISIQATVTEKADPREVTSRFKDQTYKVATAIITDETGTIKLTLWNEQIDQVNINNVVNRLCHAALNRRAWRGHKVNSIIHVAISS
jgi:replication factor A1